MSLSLDECLDQVQKSIESISTLYFKPPGIFQNAVVPAEDKAYSDVIVKLIRDGNLIEEVSLFNTDDEGNLRRKDRKIGIHDHLLERETSLKRNRALGIPDPRPIGYIPKQFYLKQNDHVLKNKRKTGHEFIYDGTNNDELGIYDVLLRKFNKDRQIQEFLYALENGSVITGEDASRRKTLFVEDFPIDVILEVFKEIVNQWPLTEYREKYDKITALYVELSSEIAELREKVEKQEAQFLGSVDNQRNSVAKLIQQERDEIQMLEQKLQILERSKNSD